ncbi:MAG: dTDP-glucose 4,6-dehydratase [Deltaproteobacteria bacterium]|nr:dTDP-glucose 4,6-dehydratase [Deltaproteobacteria bacterium]
MKNYLVTGGCGFIGTNFVRRVMMTQPGWRIINLDALTYAGNYGNICDIDGNGRHEFVKGSILDEALLKRIFQENELSGVIHFAAESHVDRSIWGPAAFVETNINGTFRLLQMSLEFWKSNAVAPDFRFLNVSTDEVYGSLGPTGYFTEATRYDPSSPYSASKAASDHFVRAYHRTFGLPTLITNCSNNYGPYQFPEKLIPLMILNIINEQPLPVYGDGRNVRDWLFVEDHCDALIAVIEKGAVGETYNVGGNEEKTNIAIVNLLCDTLDSRLGRGSGNSCRLIKFVADRPGHDLRYAIDAMKILQELGWSPKFSFAEGISRTIDWYLENTDWVSSVVSGEYQRWMNINYSVRK